jgi:ABC-type multidrug transport system permease subunit
MNNYSKDDYLVTYENIYGYKNYNKVIILLFMLLLIIFLIIVLCKFN